MNTITCPVCHGPVDIKFITTRKSKPGIHLLCRKSGSHYRVFINDQDFIARMQDEAEVGRAVGRVVSTFVVFEGVGAPG